VYVLSLFTAQETTKQVTTTTSSSAQCDGSGVIISGICMIE